MNPGLDVVSWYKATPSASPAPTTMPVAMAEGNPSGIAFMLRSMR
jgi:hypothetical protein